MRSIYWREALALLVAGWLAACASVRPPPPRVIVPPAPPASAIPPLIEPSTPVEPTPPPANPYASLAGWRDDDHAAALAEFQAG